MSAIEEIVEKIDNLKSKKTIGKKERAIINEGLETMKEHTTKQEDKHIEKFNEIIEASQITKDIKTQIETYGEKMIKIIRKYEEYYNNEPNEDKINEALNADEVEEVLDNKVDKYNKHDDQNPMIGVSYDKTKKKYIVRYNGIQKTSIDVTKASESIIKIFTDKNGQKILKNVQKIKFIYANHYFMSYWHQNEPYFDIRHILSLLNTDDSTTRKKYSEHSKEIEYYIFHPNSFGGYILRELIPESTFYKIVMHSNSDFSKKFKEDVIKILQQLRKNGQLKITNDAMTLRNNNKTINSTIIETSYPLYFKNNERHAKLINKLIELGKKISMTKYKDKHIMYAYIVELLDKEHNYYIIKFGYTYNLAKRKTKLETEYKAKFYLLRAKIITSENDEENFHAILKATYGELVEEYTINGKKKTELYKFSPQLLEEYKNYLDDNHQDDEFDFHITTELDFYQNSDIFYSDKMIEYMTKQRSEKHEKEMAEHNKKMTELRYKNGGKEVDINDSIARRYDSETKLLLAKKQIQQHKKKSSKNKKLEDYSSESDNDDVSIEISSDSEDMPITCKKK